KHEFDEKQSKPEQAKPEKEPVVEPKTPEKEVSSTKKDKKNKEETGLIFKVQIATSSQKKELTPENFNGIEDVTYYEAGGIYRYTVGNEKNIEAANILQLKLKEKGFTDAFIVAF